MNETIEWLRDEAVRQVIGRSPKGHSSKDITSHPLWKAANAMEEAIFTEREACAVIAESDVPSDCSYGPGMGIAKRIRERSL